MVVPRLTIQSDKTQLKDSSGTEIGTADNRFNVDSRNDESLSIQGDILKELKKITMHLALITDVTIQNKDVED